MNVIRPDFESDDYDVRDISFEAPSSIRKLAVLIGDVFDNHHSTARIISVSAVIATPFVAWSLGKEPWAAVVAIAILFVFCVFGVFFDSKEKVRPGSSGSEPEMPGHS